MKSSRLAIGTLAVAAVAFAGGWIAGGLNRFSFLMEAQQAEVQGSLDATIETLSFLRVGELDRAVRLMELRVSAAVSTLPQQREWTELPRSLQQSLVVAERYLEAYPPADSPPWLLEALTWIPDEPLDPESCRPVVRRLLAGE